MELKLLEDFLSLAATHSFSRSAELRRVTQSAFSRRIRSLEVWLGADLLDRSTYPITLTPEGRRFRETAEEVVRLLAVSRSEFRNNSETARLPAIAITALHSLSHSFLPRWLKHIGKSAGPMTSRVLSDNFNICLQALVEGGYDFLLTFHHPGVPILLDPDRFAHRVLGHDTLVAVAAPDLEAIGPETDRRLPLLQYSRGSFLGLLTSIAQGQEGAPATYLAHTNENSMADALKSMALEGHGLAWLPHTIVAKELEAGTLLAIGPQMPMEIRLYRSADRSRAFLERVWNAASAER